MLHSRILADGQMEICGQTKGDVNIPLLSRDTLEALEHELEDPEAYLNYVRLNHDMWPNRYKRLSEAIRAGDITGAMDAVLSLRSSSQMIGATQLAEAALETEYALREGQLSAAESLLTDLQGRGIATMAQIRSEFSLGAHEPVDDSDWTTLAGRKAEIRFPGGGTDSGIVDAVALDGHLMWLKMDGVSPRRMVEMVLELEVRIVL
ncbi:Hpt domain-containing protein [Arthrobacter sp. KNU40]|uniref:Hpt domain-containing protein n=1 Tax=Arthrobacter sp. KNU40 TaxID=3447965 RepID=UPI003F647884